MSLAIISIRSSFEQRTQNLSFKRGQFRRTVTAWPRKGDLDIKCNPTGIDDDNAVGKRHGLGDVMGNEDGCEFLLLPNFFQQPLHLDPGKRVERSERLVQCQNLRPGDKGPGECHALPLPTGKNGQPLVRAVIQADVAQDRERSLTCLRTLGDTGQADTDILCDTRSGQ